MNACMDRSRYDESLANGPRVRTVLYTLQAVHCVR